MKRPSFRDELAAVAPLLVLFVLVILLLLGVAVLDALTGRSCG
jgi:hypothetical protein